MAAKSKVNVAKTPLDHALEVARKARADSVNVPKKPVATKGKKTVPSVLDWGPGVPQDKLAYLNDEEMALIQAHRMFKGKRSFDGVPAYPDPSDTAGGVTSGTTSGTNMGGGGSDSGGLGQGGQGSGGTSSTSSSSSSSPSSSTSGSDTSSSAAAASSDTSADTTDDEDTAAPAAPAADTSDTSAPSTAPSGTSGGVPSSPAPDTSMADTSPVSAAPSSMAAESTMDTIASDDSIIGSPSSYSGFSKDEARVPSSTVDYSQTPVGSPNAGLGPTPAQPGSPGAVSPSTPKDQSRLSAQTDYGTISPAQIGGLSPEDQARLNADIQTPTYSAPTSTTRGLTASDFGQEEDIFAGANSPFADPSVSSYDQNKTYGKPYNESVPGVPGGVVSPSAMGGPNETVVSKNAGSYDPLSSISQPSTIPSSNYPGMTYGNPVPSNMPGAITGTSVYSPETYDPTMSNLHATKQITDRVAPEIGGPWPGQSAVPPNPAISPAQTAKPYTDRIPARTEYPGTVSPGGFTTPNLSMPVDTTGANSLFADPTVQSIDPYSVQTVAPAVSPPSSGAISPEEAQTLYGSPEFSDFTFSGVTPPTTNPIAGYEDNYPSVSQSVYADPTVERAMTVAQQATIPGTYSGPVMSPAATSFSNDVAQFGVDPTIGFSSGPYTSDYSLSTVAAPTAQPDAMNKFAGAVPASTPVATGSPSMVADGLGLVSFSNFATEPQKSISPIGTRATAPSLSGYGNVYSGTPEQMNADGGYLAMGTTNARTRSMPSASGTETVTSPSQSINAAPTAPNSTYPDDNSVLDIGNVNPDAVPTKQYVGAVDPNNLGKISQPGSFTDAQRQSYLGSLGGSRNEPVRLSSNMTGNNSDNSAFSNWLLRRMYRNKFGGGGGGGGSKEYVPYDYLSTDYAAPLPQYDPYTGQYINSNRGGARVGNNSVDAALRLARQSVVKPNKTR